MMLLKIIIVTILLIENSLQFCHRNQVMPRRDETGTKRAKCLALNIYPDTCFQNCIYAPYRFVNVDGSDKTYWECCCDTRAVAHHGEGDKKCTILRRHKRHFR